MTTATALELVPKNDLPAVLGALVPRGDAAPVRLGNQKVAVVKPSEKVVLAAVQHVQEATEGGLVVTDRPLTPAESEELIRERVALDALKKYTETRMDAIKAMVHNTLDVQAEIDGLVTEDTVIDSSGHFVVAGSIDVPSEGKRFSREVRAGAPHLSAESLDDLAEDPESEFTHEDYLACTTQVRVFDEAKATLWLREHPEVGVAAFAEAMTLPTPSSSIYVRNIK